MQFTASIMLDVLVFVFITFLKSFGLHNLHNNLYQQVIASVTKAWNRAFYYFQLVRM